MDLASAPREAQYALGDDVALDLRRTTGDRVRERHEEARDPTAAFLGAIGSVTAPYGPQMSMPSSNAALPASDVAIFMYECSGADEPWANDANPW